MKEFLIELGSVFNFDIANGAGRNSEDWVSPYPASVYQAAQNGTAEHPLCKIIADQLQAREITHTTMVINNAPTGAAVDIGAYLAGEPDCMLNFDAVKTHAAPVNFGLCMNNGSKTDPQEVAKGIANCFAALQSLATTRPVTVTPYAQNFTHNKKETTKITLEPIILTDLTDLAKLALISDSRTFRQFCIGEYLNDKRFEPCKHMFIDVSRQNAALITVSNGKATTYEQASERIKQLLKAQNDLAY